MAVDLRDKLVTMEIEVEVGRVTLKITTVTNLDALLEFVETEDEIPFWAELWPSSVVLARYLQHELELSGRRVLELGAGLGVAGLGARIAGANLVQSDFIPLALEFCRQNAETNGFLDIEYQLVDWRAYEGEEQFDLLIGADILYEQTVHEPLLDVLVSALRGDGCVILTDPGREAARMFMDKAEARGLMVEKSKQEIYWQERSYIVDIYRLTKSIRGQINEGSYSSK